MKKPLSTRLQPVPAILSGLAMIVLVFGAELVSHLFTEALLGTPRRGPGLAAVLDSLLLALVIAPLCWQFVVRPISVRLRYERRRTAAVLATMADAVVTIDEAGMILSFNDAAQAIFGYAEQEALGQPVTLLMASPQREAHPDYVKHYLAEGNPRMLGRRREIPARRKSGVLFPAELTVSEIRTGDQRIFTGIVRDISEIKETARSMERTNALLQVINQIQGDFIREGDPRLIFDDVLKHILTLTQSEYGFLGEVLHDAEGAPYLKTHALTNISWNEETHRFYDENRTAGLEFRNLRTLFGHVLATGEPLITNDPAHHPQGGGIPEGHPALNAFLGLPLTRRGQLVGMVGLANRPGGYDEELVEYLQPLARTCVSLLEACVDQRRQRETELELREREEYHRLVLDSAADAVVGMGADGTITHWSRQAEAAFGWAEAEVVGTELAERIIPSHLRDAHRRGLAHFRATGEGPVLGQRIEVIALRRDGQEFPVELTVVPIRTAGVTTFSAFIRDITARKQDEADLRAARDSAEAANRAKSQFLATMSHEIRTPMNGIIGMTELTLKTALTDEQRRYLELVRLSADSLLTIINDVLDFSKIEAGRLELNAVEFDLRREVGETLKTLSIRAHEKGLALACRIAPDVPHRLVGDPVRLRQILVNLVGNAVKFTDQGEVSVQVTRSWQLKEDTALDFSVRDTGIGIPQEKQTTIFEAFAQADMSTTREYGGTGLGLAICTRLADLMDGSLRVVSSPGHGSTFTFQGCFELARTTDATCGSVQQDLLFRELPVLVVEDNASSRAALEEELAGWGARPLGCADGPAALRVFSEHVAQGDPPAVVLLSARMPGMDGFSVAQCLRALYPTLHIPTVMLVSAIHTEDTERCRSLGIERWLTKPVASYELREQLLDAFGLVNSPVTASAKPPPSGPAVLPGVRRILVAEDNLVNQKLALWILGRHGYEAVIAGNGREALAALEAFPFDAVLMDIQMPEMNGLEATAAIRERELVHGGHVPVIAVTAYAMNGDRERCLAAGMDAYITKPLSEAELVRTLETALKDHAPQQLPSRSSATDHSTSGAPDPELIVAEYGGDWSLVRSLAEIYLNELPGRIAAIDAAIRAGDAKALENAAHTLKGSTAAFYVEPAVAPLRELQDLGRSGTVEGAVPHYREARLNLKRLEETLHTLLP